MTVESYLVNPPSVCYGRSHEQRAPAPVQHGGGDTPQFQIWFTFGKISRPGTRTVSDGVRERAIVPNHGGASARAGAPGVDPTGPVLPCPGLCRFPLQNRCGLYRLLRGRLPFPCADRSDPGICSGPARLARQAMRSARADLARPGRARCPVLSLRPGTDPAALPAYYQSRSASRGIPISGIRTILCRNNTGGAGRLRPKDRKARKP